jgi:hypothetical protein
MGQHGVGYQSPYPLIIQYCPANWYDVAQIYREWALQQIWASKGPLSARDDIPQWYKDVPFYFVTYSFDEPKGWASIDEAGITCMQFADRAIRYKEFFGYDGPIPMIWYQWAVFRPHETSMRHEGTPLDTGGTHSGHPFPAKQGFADAVAKLNANGIYTQGYINTRVYDIPSGFPPYVPVGLLPYTKKDINGDSRVWSGRCEGLVDLCRTTDFHQQLVTDNSTRLIREYNTKGSYLDQFATISNACFDPTHGHPLGGGDYQFHAIRNMADKIRNAGREIDPDAVFSGENGSDAFIDVLDGMLVHRDIYPGIIPVKEAVYGGYWSSYGRHMRRQNISNDIEFRMSVGNQFVYGIKIGRINVQSTKLIEQPQYQKNMQLLKKLVQYRFVAKDYLEYGRMLRPVRFQNAMPQITFKMPDEKLLAL